MAHPGLPWGKMTTVFLRIPPMDWADVRMGHKTEIRSLVGGKGPDARRLGPFVPTPAVAYAHKQGGDYRTEMVVIEEIWQEPLGSIREESLQREGYDSLLAFKTYWLQRRDAETASGVNPEWSPLKNVNAVRFHLATEADIVWAGSYCMARLYGSYLQGDS